MDKCVYCGAPARGNGVTAATTGAYVTGIDETRLREGFDARNLYNEVNGEKSGWLCHTHAVERFGTPESKVTVNEEGDELEVDGIKFVFT